jgi:DNA-binding LacI/PurR family transcriptional regulator
LAKPVGIRDVAAELGVSIATVSRALSGDPAISELTAAAVREAARRMNYRPSATARALRTKSSTLIGVVVPVLGDSYVGEVVIGIQNEARTFGFKPLFFMSEGKEDLEAEALEVFHSEQVKELIAVSPTGKPQLLRKAVDNGLRVSVINWDFEVQEALFDELQHGNVSKRTPSFGARMGLQMVYRVEFDDVSAGAMATRHLLDLGHRQFAHLRGPNVRSSLLRLLGYRQALEAAGHWPQPVLTAAPADKLGQERAVASFLKQVKPPLGIVAYDDQAAVVILRVADDLGWRVPEDLSVVGINDIQFSSYTKPTLTSVAQPTRELGALAARALLGTGLDGRRIPPLGGSLIVRMSTAPAAAAPAATAGAARPPAEAGAGAAGEVP